MAAKRKKPASRQRMFGIGEHVRVAKKSRVVDEERAQEGLPPEERIPIDEDVTGYEGEICGAPYESTSKDGEVCLPIKLPNQAVIGVPESRLERTFESRGIRAGYDPRYSEGWDRAFGRKSGAKKKKRTKNA